METLIDFDAYQLSNDRTDAHAISEKTGQLKFLVEPGYLFNNERNENGTWRRNYNIHNDVVVLLAERNSRYYGLTYKVSMPNSPVSITALETPEDIAMV